MPVSFDPGNLSRAGFRDRMMALQELADEPSRDLLKKPNRPTDLKRR
jgi:hypothetical protein